MLFSERIGAVQPTLELHLDAMPSELRTTLWNYFLSIYDGLRGNNYFDKVCKSVAQDFIKFPTDELPNSQHLWEQKAWLKNYFYKLEWYRVYDLVEFLKNEHLTKPDKTTRPQSYVVNWHPIYKEEIAEKLNALLEREHSGYRFIAGLLTPITNTIELEEISTVFVNLNKPELHDVRQHMAKSVEFFSLKPVPDFKNSIKESICAVETLLKQKVTKEGKGLKQPLAMLRDRMKIHPQLCASIENLYNFASDEPGVRHGTWGEDNETGFYEAKYTLVMSTAFINYLLGKGTI